MDNWWAKDKNGKLVECRAEKLKAGPFSDGLEDPFIKAWICIDCKKELTWNEKMGSLGCCPHCGHTVPGTVVETYSLPYLKQIKKKRKAIPWRNKTPEQKAFGHGMIVGFLASILGALVGYIKGGR